MALLDKYPLNVAELQKGQLISTDQLREITGKKPDTDAFAFALMALQKFIHDRTDFTCKITGAGLRILTDAEAAEYNHSRFRQYIGQAVTRHAMNQKVDAANLEPVQAQQHATNLLNESRFVVAIAGAQKQIRVEAHRRATPALSDRRKD